jgi:hypothetical protein
MSLPRDPRRDLRLERLGERDGLQRAHLGDAAQVALSLAGAVDLREILAAYEKLIDAVFTAPGAAEWLHGLRLRVAKMLADIEAARRAPRLPVARDAIQSAPPGLGSA